MECDRATMFPFFAPPSPSSSIDATDAKEAGGIKQAPAQNTDSLRDHVIKQSEKLGEGYFVPALRAILAPTKTN